jgi:hypothetical protein
VKTTEGAYLCCFRAFFVGKKEMLYAKRKQNGCNANKKVGRYNVTADHDLYAGTIYVQHS